MWTTHPEGPGTEAHMTKLLTGMLGVIAAGILLVAYNLFELRAAAPAAMAGAP